jgi:two-component system, OmpR family, copper resistance phosphate regulon response regulator CusR
MRSASKHEQPLFFMRILIAEDDTTSAEFLARGLRENGFMADLSHTGREALILIARQPYDLIILDVMMPEFDGWEVLRRMREHQVQTPVLFLTACDTVSDRVKGLELGADDYLVKPYAWTEMLARVRTLLRRSQTRSSDTLTVGDLELNLTSMKAVRQGKVMDLTAKEFQMLTLLVRSKGEIVTRATLAEKVWGMPSFVESNAVDVALGRLRKKLDESGDAPLIHTIRGLGYMIKD